MNSNNNNNENKKIITFDRIIRMIKSNNENSKDIVKIDLSDIDADELDEKCFNTSAFPKLRRIICDNNKLQILDKKSFGNDFLKHLTFVHFSNNLLTNVNAIQQMDKLTTLTLSHNKLKEFDSNLLLKNLKNLKALMLDHNLLYGEFVIPQECNQLSVLVISHNELDTLNVTNINNLKKISASSNKFKSIPNVNMHIGLNELRLAHNKIKIKNSDSIAIIFNKLVKLNLLDLSSNKIENFEILLNGLKGTSKELKNLSIRGNPFCIINDDEDNNKEHTNNNNKILFDELTTIALKYLPNLNIFNFQNVKRINNENNIGNKNEETTATTTTTTTTTTASNVNIDKKQTQQQVNNKLMEKFNRKQILRKKKFNIKKITSTRSIKISK
ncbi:hypothetical protein [Aestuariivirga sp.]|uniref:hypothetical protein n=1 Tax=Aestuariivirga sp. TaxID=2650926 RepID=UPI0039E3E47E